MEPTREQHQFQCKWSPENVVLLRSGFAAGLSMIQIANSIGHPYTRCAVIGKCNRLGLKRGHVEGTGRPRRTRAESRTDQATKGRVNRTTNFNRKVRAKVLAGDDDLALEGDGMRDLPPDQSPDAVSLFEAKDTQCRWPLNDPGPGFLFCGSNTVTDDCSWCARHARMAFSPSSRPKKEEGGRSYIPSRGAAY